MKSLGKTRISLAVITLFTASWFMSCENDETNM